MEDQQQTPEAPEPANTQQPAPVVPEAPIAQNLEATNSNKPKIIVAIVVVVLLVVGGLSFALLGGSEDEEGAAADTATQNSCATTDNIEHCLEVRQSEVTISEVMRLYVTLTNVGSTDISESFPCVDNTPGILINGETVPDGGLCATAISTVELSPGESEKYELAILGSQLEPGENEVSTRWGGYELEIPSGTVTVTRVINDEESTAIDSCRSSTDVVDACTQLYALFVEGTTADDASAVFQKYDLTLITQISYDGNSYTRDDSTGEFVCEQGEGRPSYDEDFGAFSANVPVDELDETIALLEADESIEFAIESPGGLVFLEEPEPCDPSFGN